MLLLTPVSGFVCGSAIRIPSSAFLPKRSWLRGFQIKSADLRFPVSSFLLLLPAFLILNS
jgi:hypothetical protein